MRRLSAIRCWVLGASFLWGLQSQAEESFAIKCSAKPVNDPSYSVYVEFQVISTAQTGLFNLQYSRAVYNNGDGWKVEKWKIENLPCTGTDSTMSCLVTDDSSKIQLTSEQGEYQDDPRTLLSQYNPKASHVTTLTQANLGFTYRESHINDELRTNFRVSGKLNLADKKEIRLNQSFEECGENKEAPALAKIPTDTVLPAIPAIPYATRVEGHPDWVRSPFDEKKILDVAGMYRGQKVKDPDTGEIFLVP